MPIRVLCPGCRASYTLTDDAAGRRLRCTQCKQVFVAAPQPTEEEPPVVLPGEERRPASDGLRTRPGGGQRPRLSDDAPPRTAAKKSGSSTLMWLLIGGGLLGMCVLCGGGGLVVFFVSRQAREAAQQKVLEEQARASARRNAPPPPVVNPPQAGPFVPGMPNPPGGGRGPGVPNPPGPPPEPPVKKFEGPIVVIDPPAGLHHNVKPPELPADPTSKTLPGSISDVTVGGGGRYLVLHLATQKVLAIFDVNKADIVKTLPLTDRDARFAASMDKLLIAKPAEKVLERWSLDTFEREASTPLELQGKLHALTVGSASNGPLLVASGRSGQFIHIANLKPYPLFWPKQQMPAIDSPFVRASADGSLFCFREGTGGEPHTDRVLVLNGQEASFHQEWNISPSVLLPSLDDRTLYTGYGMLTAELKPIPFKEPEEPGKPRRPFSSPPSFLPAHHSPVFVQLHPDDLGGRPRQEGTGSLSFHLPGMEKPFARLEQIEGVTRENISYGHLNGALCHDRRIHVMPVAKLIVTIPATNDRLVLRRFDVEEALEKSGLDYLYVVPQGPQTAARGADYESQIIAKSKKGGVKYQLFSGPNGLTISPEGKVKWSVPEKFAPSHADVTVTVRDASNREVTHSFTIRLR